MITHALPKFQSHRAEVVSLAPEQLRTRIQEAFCGFRGHDLLLHFEYGGRVCLRCATCGHETPGWSTGRRDRVI